VYRADFVKILHKVHRNGLSAYEAFGVCIVNTGKNAAHLQWTDADTHNIQELDSLINLVAEMGALAGQLGSITGHPLLEIGQTQWTPSWQDELIKSCESLEKSITNLKKELQEFAKLTTLDLHTLSLYDLMALDRLANLLMQACEIPPQLVTHAHQQDARLRLQALIAHGNTRNQIFEKLSADYLPEIKSLDAQSLLLQWRVANQCWWPKKWFCKRKITSQIRVYHLQGTRIKSGKVEEFLNILKSLNEEDKYILENSIFGQEILGAAFSGLNTDWELVKNNLDWTENFSRSLNDIYQNRIEELTQIRLHLRTLIHEQADMFSAGSPYYILAANLRKAYREFSSQWQQLNALVFPRKSLCGGDKSPGILISALSMIANWQKTKSHLQVWCVWQLNKSKAYENGLQGLVDCVERGDVTLNELTTFFDFSYKNWWIKKIIDNEPLLSNFSGVTHEYKISEFKKIDEQFQQLTQNYIVAKLRGQIPSEIEISGDLSTEIAFLRREAQKQRQHKPIRQVISQSRKILPRLKPCLLMSPLSVAQYLDASHTQFDVVIFDEASQIPTWDAVGAIARGKQLVCVGDPHQLPPTNFFNASDAEGEINEDDIEEMESILDECLSIGMMCCTLDWHYRSKSEGLITFSNMQYYQNRLITFPSPVTQDQSVRLIPIDGIYDAGKSRTNRKEAEAIVNTIAEHYLSGKGKELSIGVITFNAAQEALINKLMDAKRLENHELDIAISESPVDSLLIKNLENVQGNERDIILFSTTFGKDINGKISINFGPINKEGGHRRLNVAASRARYEVRIFSSLRPEHIDLSRTKARGVADLKAYLDFALNGPGALLRQALPTGHEPDSPFEAAMIKMLRDQGWEVHPQVGVSGYRIDLAVVNPHARGNYLLGIECDGATYHSAASARDRDRLRQMILEGLGWKIHRIWSTDWWLNPEIPMQKLLRYLNELEQAAAIEKTSEVVENQCQDDPIEIGNIQ
jgi:very-short-patch-repair endonuclease